MLQNRTYAKTGAIRWGFPNHWDFVAFALVLAIFVLLGWGATQMTTPYQIGQPIPISLDPQHLPYYAFRSVLRMFIGLIFSLLFTFTFATAAAKSRHAERLIIPMIDILQSVPNLGYLSITIAAFIALFPGSILGPECAAIFVVFTSQVWNMALSFYQSLLTVPQDLHEAADMFQLSRWQRFWRIEAPFAMPGLLWNTMLSMSGCWFFVVASEAITVANQHISLPGVGSYIALAVAQANLTAVGYAIITMLVVILLYDQLLFRPLNQWIQKFKFEQITGEDGPTSWIATLFQRTRVMRRSVEMINYLWDAFVNIPFFIRKTNVKMRRKINPWVQYVGVALWYLGISVAILATMTILMRFIFHSVTFSEGKHVFFLGLITGIKVMILIMLSSLIWIPIGVWIGLRPAFAEFAQPAIQFLASFPANLLFPIVVLAIVRYDLNADIWTAPLMVLGTQWYIAFNIIAGTMALPKDLLQACSNLNIRGWLWWKRLILPGIFPYFVTGAMTAAGGAWNASIVAETVSWGKTHVEALGLGSYITHFTMAGDFPRIALGIGTMCLYVVFINRLVWRPLYNLAERKFTMS